MSIKTLVIAATVITLVAVQTPTLAANTSTTSENDADDQGGDSPDDIAADEANKSGPDLNALSGAKALPQLTCSLNSNAILGRITQMSNAKDEWFVASITADYDKGVVQLGRYSINSITKAVDNASGNQLVAVSAKELTIDLALTAMADQTATGSGMTPDQKTAMALVGLDPAKLIASTLNKMVSSPNRLAIFDLQAKTIRFTDWNPTTGTYTNTFNTQCD